MTDHRKLRRICVFTGSGAGRRADYAAGARALAAELVARGLELVYGGGNVGLMGVIADAVVEGDGRAIGVIPDFLQAREVAHTGLTELRVVSSMHARKAEMAELADAFVALPGGVGTLEELFEIFTWGQLGMHGKPFGLLNVAGYYDGLIAFLENAVAEGFVRAEHRAMLFVEAEASPLLDAFETYAAPPVETRLDRDRT